MIPIEFKQQNVVFAKDQPEYLPLPAFKKDDGQVTSCWKLTIAERLKVLVKGTIWFTVHTFNKPLQPQRPHIDFNK